MPADQQNRPDPDALLAQINREQPEKKRGRLKIFFGAAPGVGKTYAMLQEAHRLQAQGVDVVIGWIDTHGRKETEQQKQGFEIIEPKIYSYREIEVKEFDLDQALRRHPGVILVDELAHTNAEGARHPKRFQDVLELIDAGIDVYTTLNVQHVESVNDIVAQITYVHVRETVPDVILEKADDVELIDLPPEELLERLSEGKVYVPAQAEQAAGHFFRKGNLLALRELALRYTADHVETEVQQYRKAHGISSTWNASERILVCIGPHTLSEKLIRTGRRMAHRLQAPWSVIYIESPKHEQLSEHKQALLRKHLHFAETLGAKVVTLSSTHVRDAILDYARQQNVTKLLVGKPNRSRIKDLFFGSLVDALIRESGEIDVYVITGQAEETKEIHQTSKAPKIYQKFPWLHYVGSGVLITLVTLLSFLSFALFDKVEISEIIMLYLLCVMGSAFFWGRFPAIFTSLISVLVFDFCFIPPRYTFAVSDTRYFLTFSMMFGVGLLISHLTTQVRWLAKAAQKREKRTQALYDLSQKLNQEQTSQAIAQVAVEFTAVILEANLAIFLPNINSSSTSHLTPLLQLQAQQGIFPFEEREKIIVDWTYTHKEPAGFGTSTLAASKALFVPLRISTGCVGVLGILPNSSQHRLLEPETRSLLTAFCDQIALALERALWAEQAQQAQLRAEKEELHNTLLRSISHDLKTPLAVITGAVSTLLPTFVGSSEQKELLQSAYDQAEYLHRLVKNLLDITRLESAGGTLHKEWLPLEEVVGSALRHLEKPLQSYPVMVDLPSSLPLIFMDGVLMEQVFFNLLENIIKHTPPLTPIEIRARAHGDLLNVAVADKGPGLPPGTEEDVFEKFYHGDENTGGIGLGLSICRAIVKAHGGTISAINRREGGVVFCFTLPLQTPPVTLIESTS